LTGKIVYRYEDIYKTIRALMAITPIQALAAAAEPVLGEAVSRVDIFLTPHHFKDGILTKPIELDDDELSDTLLDLTNSQMMLKSCKRVFHEAKSEGPVLGKEGYDYESENLEMSSNLFPLVYCISVN
jgi:hypothetical protein